jgi:DNA polymerase-3 subunit delta
MLLKGEQLAAHLERELRRSTWLYGDEPLLVIEAADAIRAAARQQGYSEREVLTVLPLRLEPAAGTPAATCRCSATAS